MLYGRKKGLFLWMEGGKSRERSIEITGRKRVEKFHQKYSTTAGAVTINRCTPLRPNPPLTRPVGGANASKPSREERRGRAKVRSGWGKKGRVRPINYTRRKNRGTATVKREEEWRERESEREGKSEEGRIVGSRHINRGGCAEARFLRVFLTPSSKPPPYTGRHYRAGR